MAETAEETAALSRAKLEQKDRAELAAIVEAMGGKATSRVKKADLVELVLQLAGTAAPPPAPELRREVTPAPAPAKADATSPASPDDGDAFGNDSGPRPAAESTSSSTD